MTLDSWDSRLTCFKLCFSSADHHNSPDQSSVSFSVLQKVFQTSSHASVLWSGEVRHSSTVTFLFFFSLGLSVKSGLPRPFTWSSFMIYFSAKTHGFSPSHAQAISANWTLSYNQRGRKECWGTSHNCVFHWPRKKALFSPNLISASASGH